MQQEIVPISTDDAGNQFCDARDLHVWLGVGRRFTTWIQGRIEEWGFVEGKDFVVDSVLSLPVSGSAKARPQEATAYHLTLNMAKELGMLENTPKGREVRQYFIKMEESMKRRLLADAERHRLADISRLDGRIKALERIAPDYPVQEGAKRFTVMSAYQEDCRNWVKYRKNKDLEMSHGSVYEHPLTLLFQGWQPYARLDEVATIVGLSMPQVKKLAPSDEFLEFEGIHYICTNRLPEPLMTQ